MYDQEKIENQLASIVVDASLRIHKRLGPGLFESVYEEVLFYELEDKAGLSVKRQAPVQIRYDDLILPKAFFADLVVEDKLIIELKAVEEIKSLHKKQLLTYLRLTDLKLGLLVNFGGEWMKDNIKRVANNL